MILIGLNGLKGSGKNTAARFIRGWGEARGCVVVEHGFAESLKLSASRALDVAGNVNDALVMMDALKGSGFIEIVIPSLSYQKVITGREFLQLYGTEAHREVFGDSFWIDRLLPFHGNWQSNFVEMLDYNNVRQADIALVTDCRFDNEAIRIKQLGGHVWNIDRGWENKDAHASERSLSSHLIDKVVDNRSTLEDFELNVHVAMTSQYGRQFNHA